MRPEKFYYDQRAADIACDWIEKHCVFTEDKWAGLPFKLEPWQANDIIRPLFGWKRKDNHRRRYKRVIVWVPRKNGKTELAASVSLLALCATGIVGGQVYSIASDKDQARIVFNKAAIMAQWSPTLSKELESLKDSIFCAGLSSVFRPMSGVRKGKHGYSATGIVGDEVHEWADDRVYTFLHQGSANREETIEFLISTAGVRSGYGWELWQECQKILDGTIIDDETLIVIYAAGEDDDWTSAETHKKANPNYGISVLPEYLESECRKAQENPRLENDFKRYHLNIWTEQETRWLAADLWAKCTDAPDDKLLWQKLPELMRGRKAFGGLDLASNRDITALNLVFPPDEIWKRWVWLTWCWVPQMTVESRTRKDRVPYDLWVKSGALLQTPGNVTDYAYVKKQVYQACEDYAVTLIGYDRWNSSQAVVEMSAEGVPLAKFGQGFASMSPASKAFERHVLAAQIEHGNHPVLNWCFRNLAVETDAAGNIKPSKEHAKEKIDPMVAGIMAHGVANGEQPEEPDDISAFLNKPVMVA